MKIRSYWKETIDRLVLNMADEGYDAWAIMCAVSGSVIDILGDEHLIESEDEESSCDEDIDIDECCVLKKPYNHRSGYKHDKPYEDKSLSSRFEGLRVFIEGSENESLARIVCGYNNKVKDLFELISTGERLTGSGYLERFTEEGKNFLNYYHIRFEVNPELSLGNLKKCKYDKIKTVEDIINYSTYNRD